MKEAYLAAGLLALYLPFAGAIDLNKDAMKAMQEEGERIIAADQGSLLRSSNGKCLHDSNPDKAGSVLTLRGCDSKSPGQKWWPDDRGRLAGPGGMCVTVKGKAGSAAATEKCSGVKTQKWQLDGKNRLTDGAGLCLSGVDSKVVSAGCSNAPDQVWRRGETS